MKRISLGFLAIALTVAISGCGDAGPNRVPVQGKIVLKDGKPVFPGSVAFEPIAGSSHRSSTLLNEGGTFKMRTYPYGEGVVPGVYKVILSLGAAGPAELAKYGNLKTTPLEIEIPETGNEDLTITLNEVVKPVRRGGPPNVRRR